MKRLWIAVEAHLVKRYIVHQAAEYLGVTPIEALGHLVAFWGEVAEDAKGGDISSTLDGQIEAWAIWEGELGLFARFIREHCVTDGVIRGWEEMQGPLEARRDKDRERVKAWRTKQRVKRTGNVTVALPLHLTEQNSTVPITTTTSRRKKPAPVVVEQPAWVTPIAAAWEARNGVGSFQWGRYQRALKPLRELPSAAIAERLERYLGATDPKFVSMERFVQTHGQYAEAPKSKRREYLEKHGMFTENGDMTDALDLLTNPDRRAEMLRAGLG